MPDLPQTAVAAHTPIRPYTVNGVPLPDIPYEANVPVPTGGALGGLLPAGASFTLIFATPSLTTQRLLVDKTEVTMQFGLFDGSVITGLVLLESSITYQDAQVPTYVPRAFGGTLILASPGVGRSTFQVRATLVQSVDLRRRVPAFQLM